MKYVYYFFIIASLFSLVSCSDNESEYEPIYSPVGNTYESQGLSLFFESADSVQFQCLYPWDKDIKGKAAYKQNGALLCIESPFGYGIRPTPEDLTIPYFYEFWGIVKADRLENVSCFFIGPHEQLQYMDYDGTFYLIRDK
ncbi:hypothetical protein Bacsa_2290 [Phocaeicola salanitronis DSM 18170]|uniref:Lipoprotein n=1 Tax=Phocaeicola salanitronis (strain DSM 18170 / JCM 13657 / CCUG 60908 / BL78) TaxID=667015 RepID=F0R6F1_PHOSB|nr:hypothetical protein [Phocaeicola salanitronis]ADY36839.1 hypothetical protein Bacsa_2290 [Phocaeicola salanitronis DSM 18170]